MKLNERHSYGAYGKMFHLLKSHVQEEVLQLSVNQNDTFRLPKGRVLHPERWLLAF